MAFQHFFEILGPIFAWFGPYYFCIRAFTNLVGAIFTRTFPETLRKWYPLFCPIPGHISVWVWLTGHCFTVNPLDWNLGFSSQAQKLHVLAFGLRQLRFSLESGLPIRLCGFIYLWFAFLFGHCSLVSSRFCCHTYLSLFVLCQSSRGSVLLLCSCLCSVAFVCIAACCTSSLCNWVFGVLGVGAHASFSGPEIL